MDEYLFTNDCPEDNETTPLNEDSDNTCPEESIEKDILPAFPPKNISLVDLSDTDDSSLFTKKHNLLRSASVFTSIIFCLSSILFFGLTTQETLQKFSRQKVTAYLQNEVFSSFFSVKAATENNGTGESENSKPPENSGTQNELSEENLLTDEVYPIEKADLSTPSKNIFSLNNQTYFSVNTSSLLSKGNPRPTAGEIYETYGKNAPVVLIVHTHGSEAYSNGDSYVASSPFRSQDTSENVVAVGSVMTNVFTDLGINVLHDTEMYDLPTYKDSYERSRSAVTKHLENEPSITYVLDVHRDAIIRDDKTAVCPVGNYNGYEIAQAMLVVGTNQDGAEHENWEQNLALALQFQNALTAESPGIARNINLRSSAFNQGVSNGALLLEVGSCGNTLVQAKRCAVVCAYTMSEVILGEKPTVNINTLLEKYASE